MIYRGTREGYRPVAVSAGLRGRGLTRSLMTLSRLPAEWPFSTPVYTRTAIENGWSMMATAVDPFGARNHHISHIFFLSSEEAPIQSVPLDAYQLEYPETQALDILEEIESQTMLGRLRWDWTCATRLFQERAGISSFISALIDLCQPAPLRPFKGVCVRAPGKACDVSRDAYSLMEALLYFSPAFLDDGLGYRSLWTQAENNVQYPVFFASEDLDVNIDQILYSGYLVINSSTGEARCVRGKPGTPTHLVNKLTEALFLCDEPAISSICNSMNAFLKERRRIRTQSKTISDRGAGHTAVRQQHSLELPRDDRPQKMDTRPRTESEIHPKEAADIDLIRSNSLIKNNTSITEETLNPALMAGELMSRVLNDEEAGLLRRHEERLKTIRAYTSQFSRLADKIQFSASFIQTCYEMFAGKGKQGRRILTGWSLSVAMDADFMNARILKAVEKSISMGKNARAAMKKLSCMQQDGLPAEDHYLMLYWRVMQAVFYAAPLQSDEKVTYDALDALCVMNTEHKEMTRCDLIELARSYYQYVEESKMLRSSAASAIALAQCRFRSRNDLWIKPIEIDTKEMHQAKGCAKDFRISVDMAHDYLTHLWRKERG